jgi:hypothetical protein
MMTRQVASRIAERFNPKRPSFTTPSQSDRYYRFLPPSMAFRVGNSTCKLVASRCYNSSVDREFSNISLGADRRLSEGGCNPDVKRSDHGLLAERDLGFRTSSHRLQFRALFTFINILNILNRLSISPRRLLVSTSSTCKLEAGRPKCTSKQPFTNTPDLARTPPQSALGDHPSPARPAELLPIR